MKKLSILLNLAFIAILFSSCNPSEREVKVKDVTLNGFAKKYFKVVDGTYKFTNNGDEASITVKFELKEKPTQEVCKINYSSELRINAIGEEGSIFDTGIYGFAAKNSELDKLIELMKDGKVGEQKSISFTWNYYGVSKEEGEPIFKKAMSFEVTDKAFVFCSEIPKENNSTTQASETSSSETSSSETSGSEDYDKMLDSYDEYVTEYVNFYKKAMKGDQNALEQYPEMLEKTNKFEESIKQAQSGGNKFSTKQMARMARIQNRMLKAMSSSK